MKKELKFLITAGPTREFIDPVRYISNRSSGKMGYALAEAARRVSSRVILVSGPTCLKPPRGVEVINVISANQMAKAVFEHFPSCDVAILCAAVADFRPRQIALRKIKKENGVPPIELVPTIDILAALGKRKRHQLLVGFAAETDAMEENALKKLHRKRLDMIVANNVSAPGIGFESNLNEVTIFHSNGNVAHTKRATKKAIARTIIRECLEVLKGR